jgi:hypothetical protein
MQVTDSYQPLPWRNVLNRRRVKVGVSAYDTTPSGIRIDVNHIGAGVMVWEFPDAAASWIQQVRSLAFPE